MCLLGESIIHLLGKYYSCAWRTLFTAWRAFGVVSGYELTAGIAEDKVCQT